MPFQIIRNDITKVKADAIVNTANPRPVIGGGTDSAIYRAAGESRLLAERRKIGDIAPGKAVSTLAFDLDAKYIIHTVGPVWIDGAHEEREILRGCYANALALAAELGCESIAFPMIATGTYGFPKDEALDIALKEIGKFLLTNDMDITLVVFDRKAVALSEKLVGEIDKYIDEHTVGKLRKAEYGSNQPEIDRSRRLQEDRFLWEEKCEKVSTEALPEEPDDIFECFSASEPKSAPSRKSGIKDLFQQPHKAPQPSSDAMYAPTAGTGRGRKSLSELLSKKEDTFQERLFKLIDERGLDDVTVYKRANGNRKNFSKLRCDVNYHPKKITAIAYGIALHLNMAEMLDLLSRAGYTLSPNDTFDLIISYFVESRQYDIIDINITLFDYGQPQLSS